MLYTVGKGVIIMDIQEIVKVSSRGQITIPNKIRELLHITANQFISFKMTKQGALISPVEIIEKEIYSQKELDKLEKLAKQKEGDKTFKDAGSAIKYIDSL